MNASKTRDNILRAAAAALIMGTVILAAQAVGGQAPPPANTQVAVKTAYTDTNNGFQTYTLTGGFNDADGDGEWDMNAAEMPNGIPACIASWGAHDCTPTANRPGGAHVERWTTVAGEYCQRKHSPDGSISPAFCWVPTRSPVDPLTPLYDPLVIVDTCGPDQEAEITVLFWAAWDAYDEYEDEVRDGIRVEDPAVRAALWADIVAADDAYTECIANRP